MNRQQIEKEYKEKCQELSQQTWDKKVKVYKNYKKWDKRIHIAILFLEFRIKEMIKLVRG